MGKLTESPKASQPGYRCQSQTLVLMLNAINLSYHQNLSCVACLSSRIFFWILWTQGSTPSMLFLVQTLETSNSETFRSHTSRRSPSNFREMGRVEGWREGVVSLRVPSSESQPFHGLSMAVALWIPPPTTAPTTLELNYK